MSEFFQVTLGGLLGSSVATALLGLLFLRRTRTVESEIKANFDRQLKIFESTRSWKEQALFELLGPVVMQLQRTKHAFERWKVKDLGLEAMVIRTGNLTIRDLLLGKGHLIPATLHEDAMRLVAHYDAWLLKFDELRGDRDKTDQSPFVFVGPDGYPFPRASQDRIIDAFFALRHELYNVDAPVTTSSPSTRTQ